MIPRRGPSVALAAGVTAAGVAGLLPSGPPFVHAVALPPLDLVHDLRFLLVSAPSLPLFLAGLAVSVCLRVVVLAWLLGGPDRRRLAFAVRFYAAALPVAASAAALSFGAGAVVFYALGWAAFLASVVCLVAYAAVPWTGTTRLRTALGRSGRRWLRAGTVLAYLAALVVVGAAADALGDPASVLLVPVSTAITWGAAWTLATDPGSRLVRRAVALAPAAGIVALAVVARTGPPGPDAWDGTAPERPGSLMLMSGIDSSSGRGAIFELDPRTIGFTCEQTYYYSYSGPGDGAPQGAAHCPIRTGARYGPRDTFRSGAEHAASLADQVAVIPPPVVLIAHSQGVWVAWQAVSEGRTPQVSELVLVGPFPANPTSYPSAGERGPGRVGRLLVELVSQRPRVAGLTAFQPDAPLVREFLADPHWIERVMSRPLPPGVRALSVPSVFDLPLMVTGRHVEGAEDACPLPVIHPNLPYSSELVGTVDRFLDGRGQPGCPRWRTLPGHLVRAFVVPRR